MLRRLFNQITLLQRNNTAFPYPTESEFGTQEANLLRNNAQKHSPSSPNTLMILLIVICLLFISPACNQELVVPVDNTPGKRIYTWTYDTLAYPGSMQTEMGSIWGYSPTDLYTVGWNDLSMGVMYHYDGQAWKSVKISRGEGGNIIGIVELNKIIGFGSNDIYAVGEDLLPNPIPGRPSGYSLAIHFDGIRWTRSNLPYGSTLVDIYGNDPADIYAVGVFGTFLHYNGSQWKSLPFDSTLWFQSVGGNWSAQLVTAWQRDSLGSFSRQYLMQRFDNSWRTIDTYLDNGSEEPLFGLWIRTIGNRIYSIGSGVFVFESAHFHRIFNLPGKIITAINGTRENHIFVAGDYDIFLHYNGSNWDKPPGIITEGFVIMDIWCTEDEVFLVCKERAHGRTIIAHGK